MDFSRLPDNVFLQIFDYLPIEDQARLGGVNKSFHRFSRLAISGTKCLNWRTEARFRNLSADQLVVILDLCSPNLERICFPFYTPTGIAIQWATTLANYLCPRLTHMDLGETIDYAVFAQLIRNNPNIESLIWQAKNYAGFPDVTNNQLKKLKLGKVNDVTLQAMTGRCPNLEELYMVTKYVTANVLDGFFASTPQIQRIEIHLEENQIVFEDWVNFWNLPLISLIFVFYGAPVHAEDDTLYKVATSFPHLQQLVLSYVSEPSSGGIAALAALKDLEILHLGLSAPIDDDDAGIRELAACKKLRHLTLWISTITPLTLITLLRDCPHLEYILIADIDEVETQEQAAIVLGALSGIPKRDIAIVFRPMGDEMENWLSLIWESEAVNEAIGILENEGLKVKIDWEERVFASELEETEEVMDHE